MTAIGFQKDSKWMFSASEDGSVKIWDLRFDRLVSFIRNCRAPGCQRNYTSKSAVNSACLHPNQGEIVSGDQDGFIRVWDLTANACSYELVPDGKVAVRSVHVAADASMVLFSTGLYFIVGRCI